MKCKHEWVKTGNFLFPNAPEGRYRCHLCKEEIVSYNGPDPYLEAKVMEKCATLAENLTWADNKGIASAIRARINVSPK